MFKSMGKSAVRNEGEMKKHYVKNGFAALGVGLLAIASSACTSASETDSGANVEADTVSSVANELDSDQITIGFAMPDASVTYWTAYISGVEEKAEELGVAVTITDARNDANTQYEQVLSLLTTSVDGIVLPPVDTTSLVAAVEASEDANVPLITSNRAIEVEYGGLGGKSPMIHVGFNDVEIGRQQGEMIASACEGVDPCEVALLMQPLGSTPQIERTAGFKETIEAHPNITIVSEQSDKLDANVAMELTRTIVQQYPSLDIIASQYDDTAVASAKAVSEAGADGTVSVYGIGGSKAGVESVIEGALAGTVWVSPKTDGADALEAVVAIVRGEPVDGIEEVNDRPTLPVELVQVTSENAADYPGEW